MKRHPHQSNQNRMILWQTPPTISRETGKEGAPKYAAYCTKVIVPRPCHRPAAHTIFAPAPIAKNNQTLRANEGWRAEFSDAKCNHEGFMAGPYGQLPELATP